MNKNNTQNQVGDKGLPKNAEDRQEDFLTDEPLTYALVLRGERKNIQMLKDYLELSSLKIIYTKLDYGHLYITTEVP